MVDLKPHCVHSDTKIVKFCESGDLFKLYLISIKFLKFNQRESRLQKPNSQSEDGKLLLGTQQEYPKERID